MARSFSSCYLDLEPLDARAALVRSRRTGALFVARRHDLAALPPDDRQALQQDLLCLKELRHPNVLRLEDLFCEGDTLIAVTEFCGQGSLKEVIQRRKARKGLFSQRLALNWFLQLLLALDFLHSRSVVHRDLRPANVFVTDSGNLKLGHFHLAKSLGRDNFAMTFVGAPSYMSPEMLQGLPYTTKHDVWALGCLLHQLCSLKPAFRAKTYDELQEKVLHGQPIDIPKCYSKFVAALARRCLRKDPGQRPSCRDLARLPMILRVMQEYIAKGGCLQ